MDGIDCEKLFLRRTELSTRASLETAKRGQRRSGSIAECSSEKEDGQLGDTVDIKNSIELKLDTMF